MSAERNGAFGAAEPVRIRAVVSRGGRPDLTGENALAPGAAPTLPIVGGVDVQELGLATTAISSNV